MTRKMKYLLAGAAATAVGLAAVGAMAERGHYWEGYKGRHHFGRGFGHGGGLGLMGGLAFGGPSRVICRGDSAEMADHMLVRIEHRVKPTDEQKGAFEEFKAAARTAATKLAEACPKPAEPAGDGERPKRTPIERLAETQAGLEASLDALKTFRPAAEKFYAALTDEQKAKLDRRGERWGKGHWKRDRGPRDGGDQDGAPEKTPEGTAPEQKG